MNEWRKWFDTRLDNAIEAAEALEATESMIHINTSPINSRMILSYFCFIRSALGLRERLEFLTNLLQGEGKIILE
jgi:hypothetical protein